jgi:hypothetical protein
MLYLIICLILLCLLVVEMKNSFFIGIAYIFLLNLKEIYKAWVDGINLGLKYWNWFEAGFDIDFEHFQHYLKIIGY